MKVTEYNELYDLLLYAQDEVKNNYKKFDELYKLGVDAGLVEARKILTRFFVESNKTKGTDE